MTALLLVLLGFALIVLPGLRRVPLGFPVGEWARIAGLTVCLGFVAFELGLVLVALPTVLRTVRAAGFAEICEKALAPLAPGGNLLGWCAAAIALLVALRAANAVRAALRNASAVEAEPWLGRHEDRGDFELVILPTRQLLAVSVPASQPQVLISDGLVDRLDDQQLEAVIRHEASHHRFGHWRFSLLAAAVERGLSPLPLVLRATTALRGSLEGWADEAAAGDSLSERAVVRAAIVSVAGPLDGLGACPETVRALRDRARRLQTPACRSVSMRMAVLAPVIVLAVASFALFVGWLDGAHHAAALVAYCAD